MLPWVQPAREKKIKAVPRSLAAIFGDKGTWGLGDWVAGEQGAGERGAGEQGAGEQGAGEQGDLGVAIALMDGCNFSYFFHFFSLYYIS